MSAGAGEQDFKAAASQGLSCNVIDRGAVQDEKGFDLRKLLWLAAKVAHAAQVAFAFFADDTAHGLAGWPNADPLPEKFP